MLQCFKVWKTLVFTSTTLLHEIFHKIWFVGRGVMELQKFMIILCWWDVVVVLLTFTSWYVSRVQVEMVPSSGNVYMANSLVRKEYILMTFKRLKWSIRLNERLHNKLLSSLRTWKRDDDGGMVRSKTRI